MCRKKMQGKQIYSIYINKEERSREESRRDKKFYKDLFNITNSNL